MVAPVVLCFSVYSGRSVRVLVLSAVPVSIQKIWFELMTCVLTSRKSVSAQAVDAVDALLRQHFPLQPGQANPNELPDAADLR